MAELTIEYVRDTLANGFYLGTSVLGSVDIDTKCLVIRKGTADTEEYIARVATLTDLAGIEEAPAGGYDWIQEPGFASVTPAVGDIVVIHAAPALWDYLGYAPVPRTVTAWDMAYNAVCVTPAFPAYAKNLSLTLYDSGFLTKGIFTDSAAACLDIFNPSWLSRTYYRAASYDAHLDTLEAAINKYVVLQSEAQSLVDATETYLDEYEGTDTETYT